MLYVAIAWTTALIRTSFPAWEKIFSFHPLIRLHIRSLMPFNVRVFDFPTTIGRPKYFSN